MLLPLQSASDAFAIGPVVVGAMVLWAGAVKAVAPHTFFRHLWSLDWIPRGLISSTVSVVAGLEAAWGAALVLAIAPGVVFPTSVALFVLLSAMSWWGVRSGRATDCGCYGGYIQPTIAQSLGLNALFSSLLMLAMLAGQRSATVELWEAVTVIVTGVAVSGFAAYAQRVATKTGKPLIDTNPLKIGRPWRHGWSGNVTSTIHSEREVLVSFLGTDCPFCSEWIRIANAVVKSPELPAVVGVVATSDEKLQSYIGEKAIKFPMATISQSLMGRLTSAVPTTVLVRSGIVRDIWIGPMPPAFVDRFRQAFFPTVPAGPLEAPIGRHQEPDAERASSSAGY